MRKESRGTLQGKGGIPLCVVLGLAFAGLGVLSEVRGKPQRSYSFSLEV
jgi:hypothetical protein